MYQQNVIKELSMNSSLAYAVQVETGRGYEASEPGEVAIRCASRALEGMQKEAVLYRSGRDLGLRLLCDEGPYLNGTDLAPPPLAYFSAGVAACFAGEVLRVLTGRGLSTDGFRLVLDCFFSMEGSALQGTMKAGALPVVVRIKSNSANDAEFQKAAREAIRSSAIHYLLNETLQDTFSICFNGDSVATGQARPSPNNPPDNYSYYLRTGGTVRQKGGTPAWVEKMEATQIVDETDHGAGAALKDSQKRVLNIRAGLCVDEGGFGRIDVQIIKPIGSNFRFRVELDGSGSAPDGYDLVSAGIAFCYMTQMQRYANIMKNELADYGVVQDTTFGIGKGDCSPVDTHVFIDSVLEADTIRKIVDMGEQTCFLHAACSSSQAAVVKFE